jgi:hypothetical protein
MKQRNLCLIGIVLTILMIAGCYSGLNTYFGTAATLACQFDGESLCQESTVWTCEYIENMGYNTYMTTDPCLADLSVTLTGDASVNNVGDTLTLTATVSSTATANYDLEPGEVTITVTDDLGNTIYSGTLADQGITGNLAPSNYETLTFDVVVDQDTTYTAEVATAAEYEFYNPDNTDTHSVTVGVVPTCNVGGTVCFGDYVYAVDSCDVNGDPVYGTTHTDDCSFANNGLGYCDSGACLTSLSGELDLTITDIVFVRYSGDQGIIFEITVENTGSRELGDELEGEFEAVLLSGVDDNNNPLTTPVLTITDTFTMRASSIQTGETRTYTARCSDSAITGLIDATHLLGAVYTFDATAILDPTDYYGQQETFSKQATTFWQTDCFESGGQGGFTAVGGITGYNAPTFLDYRTDILAGTSSYHMQDACTTPTSLKESFCVNDDFDEFFTPEDLTVQCPCTNGACNGALQHELKTPNPLVMEPVEFSQMIDENTAEVKYAISNGGTADITTPFDIKAAFYDVDTKLLFLECTETISGLQAGQATQATCQVPVTDYIPRVIEQGCAGIGVILTFDTTKVVDEIDENNVFKVGITLTDDNLLTYTTVEDWLTLYP